jgi:hypothetical protein
MIILIALAAAPVVAVRPVVLEGLGRLRCEDAVKPEHRGEFNEWVAGYFSGRNSGAGTGSSSIVGSKAGGAGIAEVRRVCEAEPATVAAGAAERVYRHMAAEHQ